MCDHRISRTGTQGLAAHLYLTHPLLAEEYGWFTEGVATAELQEALQPGSVSPWASGGQDHCRLRKVPTAGGLLIWGEDDCLASQRLRGYFRTPGAM
jgi:hypothetical protein